jgi:hypothetical protein
MSARQDASQSGEKMRRELPVQIKGLIGRMIFVIKRALTRWLVLPYFDELASRIVDLETATTQVVQRLDRPVECYAVAIKPFEAEVVQKKQSDD